MFSNTIIGSRKQFTESKKEIPQTSGIESYEIVKGKTGSTEN